MTERPVRPRALLVLLCVAQLTLLLDFSIVNVAIPDVQRDLGFTPEGVQWIASAYALAFGGFLLPAGRAVDFFGPRRMFVAGLVTFGAASLLGGLAPTDWALIVLRVVQGLGGALVAPAILTLILATFTEERARNAALGWFGASTASGFAVGVLAGGVLTEFFGWRAVLFVNVPIAAAGVAAAFVLIPRVAPQVTERKLDLPGALSATAGIALIIYGFTRLASAGASVAVALGIVVVGLLVLVLFVVVERRSSSPMVPLGIFRVGSVTAANFVGIFVNAVVGPGTLLLSLYLQDVQEYSPLQTGLAFLPFGATVAIMAQVAPSVVGRLGPKPTLIIGIVLVAAGTGVLATVGPGTSYPALILPAQLVIAVGFGGFFTTFTICGTAGVPSSQQGLASGLLNTSTQIGSALGAAVLVSLVAGTGAFASSFAAGAAAALLAAIIAGLALPRGAAAPQEEPQT